jgi:DNA-binding NarL/FixJ family response regulator
MVNCSQIRILSVDDHPLIHDGIAFALQAQSDMVLVAEAVNGRDAIDLFRTHRPDVTLMDLQMPVMSGVDAILAIRREDPAARMIALTTYSGDVQVSRALKAGASAYLLKSMMGKELIDTIRCVHSGGRRIPPQIASEMAEYMSADDLTHREIEILQTISGGCSNKVVAAELGIAEDTVKTHVKNILGKLRANDRTHAVLIALKRGFLGPLSTQ